MQKRANTLEDLLIKAEGFLRGARARVGEGGDRGANQVAAPQGEGQWRQGGKEQDGEGDKEDGWTQRAQHIEGERR